VAAFLAATGENSAGALGRRCAAIADRHRPAGFLSPRPPIHLFERLFGVQGLAPRRDAVQPPYRPDPNRGPGRPRHETGENLPDEAPSPLPLPPAPLTAIERRAFDYSALEEAMAHLNAVVSTSRQALRVIAVGAHQSGADNADALERDKTNGDSPPDGAESAPAC
jgi:hypothetical protein